MNKKINRKELTGTKMALKNEWMRKQLSIEITTAEGSRYIDNVTKRKFLMYCIRAQLEDDFLSVPELIKLIGISRAGAENMVKECEEANWIIVKRCKKNRRSIQASDITVETYRDYCDWLWSVINKSEMRNLSASINEIEKLEQSLP